MKSVAKKLWNYFSAYEKIWLLSILVLSVLFTFLFPETDDPTYTVSLTVPETGVASEAYDRLDFSDAEDDFVVYAVTVNGTAYAVHEFTEAGEAFTVTREQPETLTLMLPETVRAGDELELECAPDGESILLSFSLSDGLRSTGTYSASLEENGSTDGTSLQVNPQFFVSVGVLMALYLLDTMANVACELLISKQSRWNFMVSLLVEVVEIALCIVCMYRFATMAVTLFFWIPCDIVSFAVWSKHKDQREEELTVVKALKPWQDVLLVAAILVWTVGVGYLLTFLDVQGGIFGTNIFLKNVACYLDACVSAVGIVNGLLILFRYREQWIAWYISAVLETVINVMAGQYVLLVLKAGYLTNTTYGYIKWTKYIRSRKNDAEKGTQNGCLQTESESGT